MSNARSLFAHAAQIFARGDQGTISEKHIRIAGRSISLRLADVSTAQKLTHAFAHLEEGEADKADLAIWSWDDSARGNRTPIPSNQGYKWGIVFDNGPPYVAMDIETRRIDAYDPERKVGLFYAPDFENIALWDLAKPYVRILHWWLANEGLRLVHGAAVATEDGAALLVGRSGSGKSTTALACLGGGLRYLADDYCLLDPGERPLVHSVFSSALADSRTISMLPRLKEVFENSAAGNSQKTLAFLSGQSPLALQGSARLKVILVPKIDNSAKCEAAPITPAAVLRAMAPSTLLQFPGDRRRSLSQMASIVRQVPCWSLSVGTDPCTAATVIQELILNGES